MVKTLTQHGNSLALVIDKPILDLLNIDETTPLSITTDGKALQIAPISTKRKSLKESLATVNQRHGKALRKLAE